MPPGKANLSPWAQKRWQICLFRRAGGFSRLYRTGNEWLTGLFSLLTGLERKIGRIGVGEAPTAKNDRKKGFSDCRSNMGGLCTTWVLWKKPLLKLVAKG